MNLATWIPLLFIPPAVAFLVWQLGRKDWFPARRRRAAILLSLASAALLLAISRPAVTVQHGAAPAVIFVADASPSMRFGQPWQQAVQWVRRELPVDTRLGIVAFSGPAQVSVAPGRTSPAALPSVPGHPGTNVERAIHWAMALADDPSRTALLLYSDGYETEGDALAAATEARQRGFRLYALPPAKEIPADAAILGMRCRGTWSGDVIPIGSRGTVEVTVRANRQGRARLALKAPAAPPAETDVELHAGQDRTVSFPLTFDVAGYHTIEASLRMEGDAVPEDDACTLGVQVGDRRPILIVRYQPEDGPADRAAIPLSPGTPVHEVDAPAMPADAASLARFAAVILEDVPAAALSPDALAALVQYVADMGGGLVALGGQNSFGLGGYTDTPLDDILPVRSDPEDRPPVQLVILLDRSASMAEAAGSGTKLGAAKEAVLRIATLLTDKDRVSVIAFNHQVQPLIRDLDKKHWQQLQSALPPLRATGGTDIGPPLAAALDLLARTPAEVGEGENRQKVRRHVIAVTDGQVVKEAAGPPFDVAQAASRARTLNVTVSVVLTSQLGAWPGLRQLAEATGGRFHDISSGIVTATGGNRLARILLEDLPLAILQTSPADVAVRDRRPVWPGDQRDLAFAPIPQHLVTDPKNRAQVHLVALRESREAGKKDRPILATWQYGLGRSAAWPVPWTGPQASWIAGAAQRDAFLRTLDWAARGPVAEADYDVTVSGDGGRLLARVLERRLPDALAAAPDMTLSLTGRPGERPLRFTLPPAGPGLWRLDQPIAAGAYAYALIARPPGSAAGERSADDLARGDGDARLVRQGVVSTGPSAEYRNLGNNERFLDRLAVVGGGRVFDSPADARRLTLAADRPVDLWPVLVALAGLLILYEALRALFSRER